jgi:UDP:flavonoid glycosyltransferase YjiC (YdhE family)
MATILLGVLPQMGHVGPTLEIAAFLVELGHRIVYLTSDAFRRHIESVGAELLQNSSKRWSTLGFVMGDADGNGVEPQSGLDTWSVLDAFEQVQPDLFLVDKILAEYQLEMNRLSSVRRIIFSTSLLDWEEPHAVHEEEPLIILCPELLEHPKFRYPRKHLFYAEPAIAPKLQIADIKAGTTDRPLILCTFGTQSLRHTRLAEHYRLVFSVAEQIGDCDFLLTTEYPQLLPDLHHRPINLQIAPVIPQQTLLSRSAAFITHGGLGSIKESILAGVPMLVLPSFGDQFFNAMRVRYHGIGDALFEDRQTVALASCSLAAMLEGRFQENVASMQSHFLACSRTRLSILLIEEALANA